MDQGCEVWKLAKWVAGILFHIVSNISGSITKAGKHEFYLMLSILIITVSYTIYLSKVLQRKNEATEFKSTSMS